MAVTGYSVLRSRNIQTFFAGCHKAFIGPYSPPMGCAFRPSAQGSSAQLVHSDISSCVNNCYSNIILTLHHNDEMEYEIIILTSCNNDTQLRDTSFYHRNGNV